MSELKIKTLILGMVGTNCYLVYQEMRKEAILIDPADEPEKIEAALSEAGVKLCAILLTHGHFDHIKAVDEMRKMYAVPVYCYQDEKGIMEDQEQNLSGMFGQVLCVSPDQLLKDGDILELGGFSIRVIHTPGHTKGSCCYYLEKEGILMSGDTLFRESVGRTDFPTGDAGVLLRSVREKLFVLPDSTQVFPGHNQSTNIGHEKSFNPCV